MLKNNRTDLDYLRDVVAWANAEREDYWYPSTGALPWRTICKVYDAVHYLGAELEEVLTDDLPFPFGTYSAEEQKAINVVRLACGCEAFRMWSVVVGNIGTVYTGESEAEARETFAHYVDVSMGDMGRAAGEPVYLLCDGEPVEEYDEHSDDC